MWRSVRYAKKTNSLLMDNLKFQRAMSEKHSRSSVPKSVFTIVAVTGIGAGSIIAYGKYDPEFRTTIEKNVPYSDVMFKLVLDWEPSKDSKPTTQSVIVNHKVKEKVEELSLLKKKQDRLKQEQKPVLESEKKPQSVTEQKDKESIENDPTPAFNKSESVAESVVEKNVKLQAKTDVSEAPVIENNVKRLLEKLDKSSKDAIIAQDAAVEAIKLYTSTLYNALEIPEEAEAEEIWKKANSAYSAKNTSLKLASDKISETRAVIENLKVEIKKAQDSDDWFKNSVFITSKEALNKVENELTNAEKKVRTAEIEAKTASDYKDLVNKGREQFRNELKIVLPKYFQKTKDQQMTEDELNLLIAHAHRRIEQLQKQLARQEVTEKQRVDEAVLQQKVEDEKTSDSKVFAEVSRQQKELEVIFQKRVAMLKEDFESEMRQQLRRQAAAHADHIQEVMHVQRQELERKHLINLEEKLLHQKGVFVSEISENVVRLKNIEHHLRARTELEKAARKAQALWLACQAMKNAIKVNYAGTPSPLAKELAAVKEAAGEDSTFVATVLGGIPHTAVQRGVYSDELLKQRFSHVKKICCRVAMIDENGGSLYRYLLSYLQSFFIVDTAYISQEELNGKVDVDPSEWDTFDILSRISYCLQKDDMQQALRYANQLKGEPKNIARDWISELRLLLETKQAINSLIAHAAAISIQAYH